MTSIVHIGDELDLVEYGLLAEMSLLSSAELARIDRQENDDLRAFYGRQARSEDKERRGQMANAPIEN